MSDFFASQSGVRQGENLSPVLFSLFLNDLNDFMATRFNGLQTACDDISRYLSDDDVLVFLKLFLLLYADDTVILAENAEELQSALNAMSEYCQTWGLQVKTDKTKIIVFWKNKRGLRNLPNFHFDGNNIEFVESFSYLGVKFSYNGKFNDTTNI